MVYVDDFLNTRILKHLNGQLKIPLWPCRAAEFIYNGEPAVCKHADSLSWTVLYYLRGLGG